MGNVKCLGLPAGWLNGWLAAVGVTVLDSRVRLYWTGDSTPVAVLSGDGVDPIDAVIESWPDKHRLQDLPIAENWNDTVPMQRKISVDSFAKRVQAARSHRYSWTLSSTMTDLHVDENGEVAHGPFDPAGPGPIKWLHHRLLKVSDRLEPSVERIADTLAGRAVRVKDNGLGFDHTRLGSLADSTSMWVDPAVEVLAFFGLSLFPVRGKGSDRRLSRSVRVRELQRGWWENGSTRQFMWPAWSQAIDSSGIDALLDIWHPKKRAAWKRLGVHAAWQAVPFKPRASADTTRAFGAERL